MSARASRRRAWRARASACDRGRSQYAKTGQDGKFSFKELKAGKYRLVTARVGGMFYPAEYGQHDARQRGLSFPIREGEAAKDFRIEMMQTGSIAGRVLDEDGEPMGHVFMMALEEQYREGERFLNMIQSVATDEHGNYRLYWLAPGSYYVAAVYEDQQRRTINPDPIPPGRRGPTGPRNLRRRVAKPHCGRRSGGGNVCRCLQRQRHGPEQITNCRGSTRPDDRRGRHPMGAGKYAYGTFAALSSMEQPGNPVRPR